MLPFVNVGVNFEVYVDVDIDVNAPARTPSTRVEGLQGIYPSVDGQRTEDSAGYSVLGCVAYFGSNEEVG